MTIGNSFGSLFRITTFGESHGQALGCIVDGCPPGIPLDLHDIQKELDRRKPGTSTYVSARKEQDQVQIFSGIFNGKTTGTPISLIIYNHDSRSQDYELIKNIFRPGHADYTYHKKYGIRDYRGGGRASARETVARVAAGAIAKKILSHQHGIIIRGALTQVGPLLFPVKNWDEQQNNPYFLATENHHVKKLEHFLDDIRRKRDSVGAKIYLEAKNVPEGLGEPVFDKLDARIAYAMMGIPAVKGVSIGDGFSCIEAMGSEHNDMMDHHGFISNHSGGILGGISTGQTIAIELALKPTSSIPRRQKTINTQGENCDILVKGRHDPCVGIRAVPIAEHMLALLILDFILLQQSRKLLTI
jgi:chorismate synthase